MSDQKKVKLLEILEKNLGKEVSVTYVCRKQLCETKGILKHVNELSVTIEYSNNEVLVLPFLLCNVAIKMIKRVENDEIIWVNPQVSDGYMMQNFQQFKKIVLLTFGEESAEKIQEVKQDLI